MAALADAIRRFPALEVRDGRVLYATVFERQASRALAALRSARRSTNSSTPPRACCKLRLSLSHPISSVAEGAAELLDAMTEEIAKIAERCRLASDEIPRMHELLRETAAGDRKSVV